MVSPIFVVLRGGGGALFNNKEVKSLYINNDTYTTDGDSGMTAIFNATFLVAELHIKKGGAVATFQRSIATFFYIKLISWIRNIASGGAII